MYQSGKIEGGHEVANPIGCSREDTQTNWHISITIVPTTAAKNFEGGCFEFIFKLPYRKSSCFNNTIFDFPKNASLVCV
ncbi:hypothetical protein NECAME_01918 [Necator americanus]|uniref:Uncharacterized protein n=1 Tax=Necator americanus TaxID=51031 RepID=W2TLI0_NECAM|nr:hypothetical protein NECAME_01918 [Necator americanus]ETN82633.1 hypothetical protein NECAME_01918 [Necator americanus]